MVSGSTDRTLRVRNEIILVCNGNSVTILILYDSIVIRSMIIVTLNIVFACILLKHQQLY